MESDPLPGSSKRPKSHPSPARIGPRQLIGWREWIALPGLGVSCTKAKVDTGARTSSLHAYDLERFRRRGRAMVRFTVHPLQRSTKESILCEAEVVEERPVRSSSGHVTTRPVIQAEAALEDGTTWHIELTLASRDEMGFRMLLGRQALRHRFVVDPGHSYVGGVPEEVRQRRRAKRKARRKAARRAARLAEREAARKRDRD
jgi:hypothetical protein